jgi:Arc/MetJ family transcription regulator
MVGDVVAYRCRDCRDRWDIELTEEDLADTIPE